MISYSQGSYSEESYHWLGWFSSEEEAETFANKLNRIEDLYYKFKFEKTIEYEEYLARKQYWNNTVTGPLLSKFEEDLWKKYPPGTPNRNRLHSNEVNNFTDTLPKMPNDNLQELKDVHNQRGLIMAQFGDETKEYELAYETFMNEVGPGYYKTNGFSASELKKLKDK